MVKRLEPRTAITPEKVSGVFAAASPPRGSIRSIRLHADPLAQLVH